MSPSSETTRAHVVRVLLHEVGVAVVERPPHLLGVFLVHAEDDGLGEAVGLLQEVGQVAGDGLGAGLQRDRVRSKSGVPYSLSGISRP